MVWATLRSFFRQSKQHNPPRRTLLAMELLEDRMAPALLGNQLYPSDHPWNQRITDAPVASNSAAIINDIVADFGNGRLHPDFGQHYGNGNDLYGIPVNVVHGNTAPKVNFIIDAYPGESDIIPVPMPSTVVLEGDYQNGPKFGVDARGDSHLLVYDVDNNIAYELYRASRPNENGDGKWHADGETVWDMNTNAFRTLGWTSADAAGLSILAGLVRPDEGLPVSQGGQGVINHAIRFTLRNSVILDQYIYPASHTANPGNNNPSIQPPMGARFRLKASVDISHLHPQSRIVAQAMKDYGMILADNGSNFYFSGASASVDASNNITLTWNDDDIQSTTQGLKSLRYSDFEVVDLTPRVTDLSVHTGNAGATVTVIGQNFSGAAGQLKVLFGNSAATGVTVLDDSHVQVTVPAGSGTVHVRVQSGVTTGSNPDNINGAIFGYGISATNAGDQFTYGGEPPANQPPTVATAAKATPNPVTGSSTVLSVLGIDDGGEANLTYTWSVVAKPAGAADPTFSANGTNAAKTSTAGSLQPGDYQFQVTIRDTPGLTATSSVNVAVLVPGSNQAPTIASAASANPSAVTGKTTGLSVLGADDGGEANLAYTWSVVAKPAGAADPTFSANGTNVAKTSTATFFKSGFYQFQVTARDAEGLTASSVVSVTVVQAISSVAITPSIVKLVIRKSIRFTAYATDQFGEWLAVQPVFVWTRTGKGIMRQDGRYTAAAKPSGQWYTIRASAGGVTGLAMVKVVRSLSQARRMVILKA
ncbi:MAG: IPT/TIG domain-containing protein [Gemmataceae bacterium]|nr:IPT/TIG domain-containing protein [Gemmataceae bacterium]